MIKAKVAFTIPLSEALIHKDYGMDTLLFKKAQEHFRGFRVVSCKVTDAWGDIDQRYHVRAECTAVRFHGVPMVKAVRRYRKRPFINGY